MEVLRSGELLTDEFRPDDLVSLLDKAAVRLVGEDDLRQARHRQRVENAGDQESDDGET